MEKTGKRDFLQESWIWLTILMAYTFEYIKKMIFAVCIGLIIFFWKKEIMEEVLLSFMYAYIMVNTAQYVKSREKNKKKRLQWIIWQSALSILYGLYICIEWTYGVH